MPANERELVMLAGLGAIIRWCEELASLLAGPVLTLGLALALIDLLTDGRLLTSIPALLFVWAASQAVGLDAQLVGSAAKLSAAFRRRGWGALVGYALLVGVLGLVAYQASAVFAIQQADGLTTAQALARLGMDTATWLLERSALAVLLVILSGLLRYVAPAQQQSSIEDERTQLERELTLEPLRQRLRAQQVGGWRTVARTALGTAGSPAENSSEHMTAEHAMAAVARELHLSDYPPAASNPAPDDDHPPTGPGSPVLASMPAEESAARNVTPLRRGRSDRRTASRANGRSGKRGTVEHRIRALLAREPRLTQDDVAQRLRVSPSSASKWMAVIEAEQRAAAQRAAAQPSQTA